jgi:alpha-glucosidase (family GH31 glycosyl hydrolase)
MKDFQNHNTPLAVCIIDMDWHMVETGNESSGWTGYTWNKHLFPDPQGFLDDLDKLGLKKALNLHPASGVYPHEAQYEAMCKRLNLNPLSQQPIPFSIADPDFAQAYFEILHHPYEAMGVDFWWIDWQQGTKSDLEGLDPLFWLNHLHFYNLARDGTKRPFIFSRWAGLGSQRYPIGFSGDTYITWNTLKFQPYFTATAANVAYGWWSHDIGGHMGGTEEPELYLRWLQLGVFSPILRVHSTNNPFHERRPWAFNAEIEQHAKHAFRLRHALIPYLYTAAWVNYKEGILPIRPMYHTYPANENAYLCPNQYTFGSELMVCPFTSPCDQDTNLSRQVIWLPEGQWFDFFNGQGYDGAGWYACYGGLGQIPVFAKAGAIVPMGKFVDWGGVDLPDELIIHVFPGANNSYNLYEDDGETQDYQQGKSFTTAIIYNWDQEQAVFKIQPDAGNPGLFAVDRQFRLVFHAINEPSDLLITIDGQQNTFEQIYDEHSHQLIISNIPLPLQSTLKIEMSSEGSLLHHPDTRRQNIEKLLKNFKMESFVKQYLANQLDDLMANPLMLVRYADRMMPSHILALYETWRGKSKKPISNDPEVAYQLISNTLYHA